jgi:hypothetical protein
MCIILWVTNNERVGMATYGHTRALCKIAGKLGKEAFDAMLADSEPEPRDDADWQDSEDGLGSEYKWSGPVKRS